MFSNLIYKYNDSVYSIPHHYASYVRRYSLDFFWGNRTSKIDKFTEITYQILNNVLHPVLLNNLVGLFSIIASIFISYSLLSKLLKSKILGVVVSVLFSLPIYFLFRIISFTPALYFTFVFSFIVLLLLKSKKPWVIGVVVFIILSFGNYYGFFCFVLVCFWYLFDLVSKKINFREFVKKYFYFLLFSTPVPILFITNRKYISISV